MPITIFTLNHFSFCRLVCGRIAHIFISERPARIEKIHFLSEIWILERTRFISAQIYCPPSHFLLVVVEIWSASIYTDVVLTHLDRQ